MAGAPAVRAPNSRKVSMIPSAGGDKGLRKPSTAGDYRKASTAEMSEASESVSNM